MSIAMILAAVTLGSPFTDGMVLQRGMKCPVWGRAGAGEQVKVSFAGQSLSTTAGADGRWRVDLAPMTASCVGRDLAVTSASQTSPILVRDVLVGEVWLCSGQSNMGIEMWSESPRARDAKGYLVGQLIDTPLLRITRLDNGYSEKPRADEKVVWQKANPGLFTRDHGSFSAVGTWFGFYLQYALKDVPVGLVGAYVGATCIETWIPGGTAQPPPERAKNPAQRAAHYHNGKVNPIVPFAMRGAIWYQGEGNTYAVAIPQYPTRLKELHDGWRRCFANDHFRLYVCQLCPWGNPLVPEMQEAMQRYCDGEPDAGLAVLCDVGNLHDIHPNDKDTVGLRLACLALRRDYGFAVKADSPTLKSWRIEGGKFVMSFANAEKFSIYDPDWRHMRNPAKTVEYGFEVCGADGKWVKATIANLYKVPDRECEYRGQITGRDLVVYSDAVKEPVALRYLYSHPWRGYLMNEAGLPLGAFHIGDLRAAEKAKAVAPASGNAEVR